MAPPQDFQSAYNSNLSPVRAQDGDRNFSNQGSSNVGTDGGQGQSQSTDQQQQTEQPQQARQEASFLRPIEYETGQKRKRSFTMPGQFASP